MLPKNKRLTREEARAVMRNGKTLRTPNLVVKYSNAKKGKIAVSISKKVASSAVVRNRLRRMIYNALPRTNLRHHNVLIVQKKALTYCEDINIICSKLFS